MAGILGALIGAGANLIGAGIAARRNRVAQGQLDQIQGQNTGIIDQFEQKYGGTFDPMTARSTAGANLYADANGINGAEGNARAVNAFQTGPGYQFALDQGMQALTRGASAGGMLASGNTLMAANQFGQGLANQEYGGWLGRLAPYNDMERAGLENQAALGSLVSTARLENNAQRAEGLQSGINGRQTAIGGALGNAANAFGNVAGYGGYGNGMQPSTRPVTGGFFSNIAQRFGGGS